jgi:hypothetical protein
LSAFRIRIDLEELDVLCLGPKASSVAWTPFMEA